MKEGSVRVMASLTYAPVSIRGVFIMSKNFSTSDHHFMNLAMELAASAQGMTSPNPMVGAVVVNQGQVVGRGYHHRAGEPHAEVLALEEAGESANLATLYVTLEPCSHFGRTPPCADLCIAKGLKRIVIAMEDPDLRVQGKGIARLQQAGIQVEVGLMEQEALRLNEMYVVAKKQNRPFIHYKYAMSLDGKIACHTGESQWITNEKSRTYAHKLRMIHDGIMVGIDTVLQDDPRLNVRLNDPPLRQPVKIILDSKCRLPLTARCLQDETKVIVATGKNAPGSKIKQLESMGVEVWVDRRDTSQIDIPSLLEYLYQQSIQSILLEGGPTLAGSFMELNLIDRVSAFIAPKIIGGKDSPTPLAGIGAGHPNKAWRLTDVKTERFDDDWLITGRVTRG
jgi:diaminohydroxyphosphoribosylaminopyrimidine deaminase/5-amino-6-(5-phosphoribosylamino)uracil reductase